MIKKDILTIKTGDTLTLTGNISIPNIEDNSYLDLSAWTASSQLRRADNYSLISNLTVAIGNKIDSQRFSITVSANALSTATWQECEAICDIQLQSPAGIKISTPTFNINIIRDITNGS